MNNPSGIPPATFLADQLREFERRDAEEAASRLVAAARPGPNAAPAVRGPSSVTVGDQVITGAPGSVPPGVSTQSSNPGSAGNSREPGALKATPATMPVPTPILTPPAEVMPAPPPELFDPPLILSLPPATMPVPTPILTPVPTSRTPTGAPVSASSLGDLPIPQTPTQGGQRRHWSPD